MLCTFIFLYILFFYVEVSDRSSAGEFEGIALFVSYIDIIV